MNYSAPFDQPLYIIILIFAIISVVLSMIIIILSLCAKNKLSYTFTLILNLIFISMIHTISYCLNWTYNNNNHTFFPDILCTLQSFLLVSSTLSEEFWLTIITIKSYKMFISKTSIKLSISCLDYFIFFLLCYVFPLWVSSLYLYFGLYGANNLNCWVKSDNYFLGLILYCHKWINAIITIIFSYKILRKFNSIDITETKAIKDSKELILRVLLFPLIQLIGGLIPSIYTVFVAFDIQMDFLSVPTLISGASHGVSFPLLYLSFKHVRKELFCCSHKQIRSDELTKPSGRLFSTHSQFIEDDDDENSQMDDSIHESE